MQATSNIVIYGPSSFNAQVTSRLANIPQIQISAFNYSDSDLQTRVHLLSPALLIYDWLTLNPDFPFEPLLENPDMILVGVDFQSGKLMVSSNQITDTMGIEDLVAVVDEV